MGQTIYAPATAQGKAGVAIIRISGPQSLGVLVALGGAAADHRTARLCVLRATGGDILDHALVLYFREGASFTGEQTVELHLHGSIAGVRSVMRAIAATGLARLAEPGEFTRRALMNDRLDLTQVQGLADVIDAETEEQHRQAMRVFDGEMARLVEDWRRDLIRCLALIEATVDFADEDVPENVVPEVAEILARVFASLEGQLAGVAGAAKIQSGYDVAIVGAPNSGKSSLLNALTRSDAAIVTNVAGTTRDVIEVAMDIGGLKVNFLDTAGLRQTIDPVERIGVTRAFERAAAADLRIFLHEEPGLADLGLDVRSGDFVLRSKVDLLNDVEGISAKSGVGLDELLEKVGKRGHDRVADAGLVSRDRDRTAIESAARRLSEISHFLERRPAELLSADLREVLETLGSLVGRVNVEDVLDEIFSSFCLGK